MIECLPQDSDNSELCDRPLTADIQFFAGTIAEQKPHRNSAPPLLCALRVARDSSSLRVVMPTPSNDQIHCHGVLQLPPQGTPRQLHALYSAYDTRLNSVNTKV